MSEFQTPRPNMHEPDLRDDIRVTPPGWYDDGQNRLTWWDGERWTGRHQELPAKQKSPPLPSPRRSAPLWLAVALPVVALVAGIAIGAAVAGAG